MYGCSSTSKATPLIHFLKTNNFFVRSKEFPLHRITHTLMDGAGGGKICLPDSAITGFFAAYGATLEIGAPLFVVERRSRTFKMHFDLDFTRIHDDITTIAVIETICEATASFVTGGAGKEAWAIACAVLDSARQRKAPGIHLIFPWLKVDSYQAQWIRTAALKLLQPNSCETDWSKVLDAAIFEGNGLRMVGSDKCKDCSHCHNGFETRLFCHLCNRTGKINGEKIYWPWQTLPSDCTSQLLNDLQKNPAYAAHMCSTRVPEYQSARCAFFCPPAGIPNPWKGGGRAAKARCVDEKSRGGGVRQRVDITNELNASLIESFAVLNQRYASVEVRSVDRWNVIGKSAISWTVKVSGPGCRYCLNKLADHRQSTIYFVISARGIVQRCFSRKDVFHSNGLCASFSSATPIPISTRLARALQMDPALPSSAKPVSQPEINNDNGDNDDSVLPCEGLSRLDQSLKRQAAMLRIAERYWPKVRRRSSD